MKMRIKRTKKVEVVTVRREPRYAGEEPAFMMLTGTWYWQHELEETT